MNEITEMKKAWKRGDFDEARRWYARYVLSMEEAGVESDIRSMRHFVGSS